MNPIIFYIPFINFPITYYSLMYIIGLYLAIYIAQNSAKDYGIDPNTIKSLGYWAITSGIIGARIYYILLEWDNYKDNLLEAINIFKGIRGLAIHGGIAGAAIGLYIFSKLYKIRLLDLFDIAAPPTLLAQAIGRIGNFINGETHGVPIFTPLSVLFKGNFNEWWASYQLNPFIYYPNLVPWGVVFLPGTAAGEEFPNILLHPTMLYELVLNAAGFFILYFYFRKKQLGKGAIGGLYLIFYGVIRVIVSFFRAEDLHFMGIRAPYIASILFVMFGCLLLYMSTWEKNKQKRR